MKLGITMLIHNKDDIEFVTEFPCFFGTPCIKHVNNANTLNIKTGGKVYFDTEKGKTIL